ncbi:unnamed protein product, partial [Prorocentrum cordatum]
YKFVEVEQRESGQMRIHSSTGRTNWWGRPHAALAEYAKLAGKGKGKAEKAQIRRGCRRLALDGVPTAGRKAPDTAKLHRKIWGQRIRKIEKVGFDVLDGMVLQAAKEVTFSLRDDLRRGFQEYALWLTSAERSTPEVLYRITKLWRRRHHEYIRSGVKVSSQMESAGLKAMHFEAMWKDSTSHLDAVEVLNDLRETAKEAFVRIYNSCEEKIARPWQVLQALIMRPPKDGEKQDSAALTGGGDRALALLVRQDLGAVRLEQVRRWARGVEGDSDALHAGNSCPREAAARALGDETSQELGAHSAGALAGAKRFHDSPAFATVARCGKLQPRAWFDDIGPRAAGSFKTVKEGIVEAAKTLKEAREMEGLTATSKSVILSADFSTTKQAAKELSDASVILK